MANDKLDFNTRKSLCNHLGEQAGSEVADFLYQLALRLEAVERNKVDVTRIVPEPRLDSPASSQFPTPL